MPVTPRSRVTGDTSRHLVTTEAGAERSLPTAMAWKSPSVQTKTFFFFASENVNTPCAVHVKASELNTPSPKIRVDAVAGILARCPLVCSSCAEDGARLRLEGERILQRSR